MEKVLPNECIIKSMYVRLCLFAFEYSCSLREILISKSVSCCICANRKSTYCLKGITVRKHAILLYDNLLQISFGLDLFCYRIFLSIDLCVGGLFIWITCSRQWRAVGYFLTSMANSKSFLSIVPLWLTSETKDLLTLGQITRSNHR